jgi:Flp pilus assembly protein TadD
MRSLGFLALALLLAACSHDVPQLGTGLPSLHTAQTALQGGAPDIALNICEKIGAAEPRNGGAVTCEGDALAALGKPEEADRAYTEALVADPKSVPALLGLGRLRLADDPKRAEALFLLVLAQQPRDAAALNDLGIARDLQGHHAAAQKAYGDAIAADPDMRAAQVNLALSIGLAGHPGEATRLLLPLASGLDATARERDDLAAVLAMDNRADEAGRLLSPELQGAELDRALAGYRALQLP